MKHYVVYHSDRMPYPAEEVTGLAVYTNKAVGPVEGSRVWLLTGKGKSPKKFYLVSTFIADEVDRSGREGFESVVSGRKGRIFPPPFVRLDHRPWFPAFQKDQGNFAFGFQIIGKPEFVVGLSEAAKECGG